MPESYPVVAVGPEWVLEPEDMGTKEKFWCRKPGDQEAEWLFKYPQLNTGQHWAEKIAAEVASVLGVRHAKVELAEFEERRGSVSESFAPDEKELVHGNQILEWTVAGYDPTARFGQSDHSFANIRRCFERVFRDQEAAEKNTRLFAGYLVLDAVIGNTDRHHENWGLLRRRVGDGWEGGLAPSFDHASSLGRELLDTRRSLLLEEDRIGWYSEKGRGGIHWSQDARYGPSPLELVRRAVERHPSYFDGALRGVAELRDAVVTGIVNCVPDGWMSPVARTFAIDLICYNRNQLQELNR